MLYKFRFLLLFCLIQFQVGAQIHVHETALALHVFQNSNLQSIITIPKEAYACVELAHNQLAIDEQLGSYEIHSTTLHRSKNLSFSHWEQIEGDVYVHFSYNFKKHAHNLCLLLSSQQEQTIKLSVVSPIPEEVNAITFNIPDNSKGIFGGGIQFSHWNLRGHQFPIIVEENGIGRGDKGSTFLANLFGASGHAFASYAPLPKFYSSNQKAYRLFRGHADVIWEVNFTHADHVSFQSSLLSGQWNELPFLTITTETPLEFASNDLSEKERKEFVLQDWMQGYILGVQGGKEKVNSIIKNLKEHEIELSAVWIQDWVGKRSTPIGSRLEWDWKPNYSSYPSLETWIDSLNQTGIRVLGYINPYFVEGGEQANTGIDSMYFVRDEKGNPYKFKAGGFKAFMLDLSNPKTLEWTKAIIQENLIKAGFDGWMCDFGEWLPFESIQLNNETQESLRHNDYPEQWLGVNLKAIQDYCEGYDCSSNDFLVFNRSWHTENKDLPRVMWAGDQMGNFGLNDGLPSAITAYVSSAMSGIPFIHSDIGGYTAIKQGPFKFLRDDEILKRWIEMEAFTPVWRSHEGLIPEHMSQIYQDDDMLDFFARFDSIHQYMIPSYFQKAQEEFITSGYPIVRPLYLNYPDDPNTLDIQYQFMIGSELLICPVYEASVDQVDAYLPKGKWENIFTHKVYNGEKIHTIQAPLGSPAVFIKLDN